MMMLSRAAGRQGLRAVSRRYATAPASTPAQPQAPPPPAKPSAGAVPAKGTPWGSIIAATFTVGTAGAVYALGEPRDQILPRNREEQAEVEAGNIVILQHNQYENENFVMQRFLRARDRCTEALASLTTAPQAVLLPELLPPEYRPSDYTLVLDLEGTLIGNSWHPRHGWRAVKRPGMDYFLDQVASMFGEVIVFADRQIMDCLPVLERMDPNPNASRIMYKLHKGNMRAINGEYYKDLSMLGRDLKKVIIVDDTKERFALQPHNGIKVETYNGGDDDRALLELLPFLQAIVQSNIPDVRTAIRKYEKYDNIPAAFLENRRLQQQKLSANKTPLDVPTANTGDGFLPHVKPATEGNWLSKLVFGG
eukprot:m.60482 g.60482  ORF g.60482 m.60482 type:complete len:365 (+) comp13665_c0_seq2:59-1153(+)